MTRPEQQSGGQDYAGMWPVQVYPCGHGQWAYTAGPRTCSGYQTKAEAQEAGEVSRAAALARHFADRKAGAA